MSAKTTSPNAPVIRWATIAIVAAAVVQACVWAVTVPIFQNPDEPVHADYAFAIAHAGHPLRATNVLPSGLIDPLTEYFAVRARLNPIAFHPNERQRADYGTPPYFHMLDAAAPWDAVRRYGRDPTPQPMLTDRYPVAYYAAAGAGAAAAEATGSATASFFAMRLVSVAFFALLILASRALLLEAGLSPLAATTGTFAIAFFPELTSVAASVQPDNATNLFLIASVLFALRACKTRDTRWLLWMGCALGGLYLSKLYYFLPCFAGCVVAVIASRRSGTPRVSASALAAVAVPLLAAVAVNAWVTGWPSSTHGVPHQSVALTARITEALHGGPVAAAQFATGEAASAFHDFLWDGATIQSYWGNFGWLDTTLDFRVPYVTPIVWNLIRVATVAAWIVGLIAAYRALARLVRYGSMRGPLRALALALRDPVVSTFLLFTLTMLCLHVALGSGLGFQGRYWFPILPLTVIVTARSVAHLFAKFRRRRVAVYAILLPLALFSAFGSVAGVDDVHARYYQQH